MADRLKRRKKEPEKASGEKAQAPLQPSFYDSAPVEAPHARAAQQPEDHAEAQHAHAEASRVSESTQEQPEVRALEPRPSQSSAPRPQGTDGPARRRRRGRGGRGRSGRTAVAAPQATPESNTAPVAASANPSKGVVILAIGLPGSGKSSWFKRNKITPLSTDLLRAMLFDDATEQRFQDLVFSNLRSMLKARLIARRPTNYVDATNLTPQERQGWIKLAKDYGYEVQAVFFDVPVEVCLERNQKRERVVAEDVLRRMAAKLKAPGFEEGFGKITVVRVKAKE
ncbi:MAG TPA: AAA family ATPase [Terriglobales bacterium]|nr:AAA family ATPase [Terriglobales bacterium]